MDNELLKALRGNTIEYYNIKGLSLDERYEPLSEFARIRSKYEINSFNNCVMHTPIAPYVNASVGGEPVRRFLNFSSQDYMGLSQNGEVLKAAHEIIDKLGVHAASSPAFTGKNYSIVELEEKLAKVLGVEQAILFPTGWMACFGAITSLVSSKDAILLDAFAHNSLQTAAKNATERIYKFRHNDLAHMEQLIKNQREKDSKGAIFVVVESLYSMHADIINIRDFLTITNKYNAIFVLDIAHDFGVMGENGLGVLEGLTKEEKEEIVFIGAFTKAFATNGGFVAGKKVIRAQTMVYSPSFTFSNSISPVQTATASKCADILFSEQGKQLRKELFETINFTIEKFRGNGLTTNGSPSPIVPVLVGNDDLARIMYKENIRQGLLANLAEFPGVPKNQSLFRFQLMATHSHENITEAVDKFINAKRVAEDILKNLDL